MSEKEYTWVAPSGVPVTSCRPHREDGWARNNWAYARGSYTNIVKVAFWREPRRDLRIAMHKHGWPETLSCRLAGHVYNHMTKICYCGERKSKS